MALVYSRNEETWIQGHITDVKENGTLIVEFEARSQRCRKHVSSDSKCLRRLARTGFSTAASGRTSCVMQPGCSNPGFEESSDGWPEWGESFDPLQAENQYASSSDEENADAHLTMCSEENMFDRFDDSLKETFQNEHQAHQADRPQNAYREALLSNITTSEAIEEHDPCGTIGSAFKMCPALEAASSEVPSCWKSFIRPQNRKLQRVSLTFSSVAAWCDTICNNLLVEFDHFCKKPPQGFKGRGEVDGNRLLLRKVSEEGLMHHRLSIGEHIGIVCQQSRRDSSSGTVTLALQGCKPAPADVQSLGYIGSYLKEYECLTILKTMSPEQYTAPIRAVAQPHEQFFGEYANRPFESKPLPNPSQREAVTNLRFGLECIQGPPGSGKSTTIAHILDAHLPTNSVALVTCTQNAAIEAIVQKLGSLWKGSLCVLGAWRKVGYTAQGFLLDAKLHPFLESLRSAKVLKQVNTCERLLDEAINARESSCSNCVGHRFLLAHLHKKYRRVYMLREFCRLVRSTSETLQKDANWYKASIRCAQKHVLSQARILVATTSSTNRLRQLWQDVFGKALQIHTIILDESGRTPERELAPLLVLRSTNLVLVGDHAQLPPFSLVSDDHAKRFGHSRSLLERCAKASADRVHVLDEQYRMHPMIATQVSNLFYDGKLTTSKNLELSKAMVEQRSPLAWLDVTDGQEEKRGQKSSFHNTIEATCVVQACKWLRNQVGDQRSIALLTFYAGQLELLSREVPPNLGIQILTIDASQGNEFDYVILSTVRANAKGKIGFVSSVGRICVAMSRARYQLIIVGSQSTLSHNRVWNQIRYSCDALCLPKVGEALPLVESPQSPLADYYETHYRFGGIFDVFGFVQEWDHTVGAAVYAHDVSGIKVWAQAIDLSQGAANVVTLFHYTTSHAFANVIHPKRSSAEIWASLSPECAHWGPGVYGVRKGPAEFGSKEQVVWNNYAASTSEDISKWYPRAEFCIPIIVATADAYNVRTRCTPEMVHGLGRNKDGTPLQDGRDVWVARVLDGCGKITSAKVELLNTMCLRVMHMTTEHGTVSLDVLEEQFQLGKLLLARGRFSDAEALQKRIVEACRRRSIVLDTFKLRSLRSLAKTYAVRGNLQEAERMQQDALNQSIELYGIGDIVTALTKGELANTLLAQKRMDEAGKLQREVVESLQHICQGDPDNVCLLKAESVLARILRQSYDILGPEACDEAVKLDRHVFAAFTKKLGEKHPTTLSSKHGLAIQLCQTSEDSESFRMFEEVLQDRKSLLGSDHIETLHTRLAIARHRKHSLDERSAHLRDVVADFERICGPSHIETLRAKDCLQFILSKQGESGDAAAAHDSMELQWEILRSRTTSLGAEHADTLKTKNSLATRLSKMGKHSEAIKLFSEVLHVCEHIRCSSEVYNAYATTCGIEAYQEYAIKAQKGLKIARDSGAQLRRAPDASTCDSTETPNRELQKICECISHGVSRLVRASSN